MLCSQISLTLTFLVYFVQCGHVMHLCREMLNTMFFFTALLHKDDVLEDGAVVRDGRVFFLSPVVLHKAHNAVSWYVLRRYIKDVYISTRKLTEAVVVCWRGEVMEARGQRGGRRGGGREGRARVARMVLIADSNGA